MTSDSMLVRLSFGLSTLLALRVPKKEKKKKILKINE